MSATILVKIKFHGNNKYIKARGKLMSSIELKKLYKEKLDFHTDNNKKNKCYWQIEGACRRLNNLRIKYKMHKQHDTQLDQWSKKLLSIHAQFNPEYKGQRLYLELPLPTNPKENEAHQLDKLRIDIQNYTNEGLEQDLYNSTLNVIKLEKDIEQLDRILHPAHNRHQDNKVDESYQSLTAL